MGISQKTMHFCPSYSSLSRPCMINWAAFVKKPSYVKGLLDTSLADRMILIG